jgi:hypothetical protein
LPYDAFGLGTASAVVSDEPTRISSDDVIFELAASITISDSEGNDFVAGE